MKKKAIEEIINKNYKESHSTFLSKGLVIANKISDKFTLSKNSKTVSNFQFSELISNYIKEESKKITFTKDLFKEKLYSYIINTFEIKEK